MAVYDAARMVADCFKFRNKIGLDVAIGAVREFRRRRGSLDQLWDAVGHIARFVLPPLRAAATSGVFDLHWPAGDPWGNTQRDELGRIRLPKKSGGMTIQTHSIERAVAAAAFFRPHLGPEVVAIRCRVVNRLFAAHEGDAEDLMKALDQNVTVIDPRVAEAAFDRDFAGVRTMGDAERVAAERLRRRLTSKDDVPTVEDFPLAPEEETPEFRDLANALRFRVIRAFEHWNGNTDLTLTAIIVRTVQQELGRGSAS